MKKLLKFAFILALASTSLFFNGCSPYEEGPGLSFRSPEKRLVGSWKATKVTETTNGTPTDVTADYAGSTWTFNEDNTASYSYQDGGVTYTMTGTWALLNDDTTLSTTLTITILGIPITDTANNTILRLSNKDAVIENVDGNTTTRTEVEKI